ncbi:SDR family NAD(P)-dependent oxidoreductase [uncultured Erythrobacter sp.]|uniref:SDR family NAD(P)-dependent oxidoreductase n=1 Tax=uncultured Erythrobacter sp. TaxID=263913 RepID=UPI00262DFBC2|nr:SDR family NAD(P)-dependent oxidoreductase [uncultured Erythrobacter sp.]
MTNVGNQTTRLMLGEGTIPPKRAAIFGASGGIGAALLEELKGIGCECIYAGSRSGGVTSSNVTRFAFDLTDEASIAEAARLMREEPPQWVIVASGVLTLEEGSGPERTIKRLNPEVMAKVFAINTIGPALIAKHILPLMPRNEPFVFAALSARVGSISDNGLGGWHSYRASKAALNMLIKNFAIEVGRTHPHSVVVGLHPGTVDTDLSAPFQKGLAEGQLTGPAKAAGNLIRVLSHLKSEDSGEIFDFAGKEIRP